MAMRIALFVILACTFCSSFGQDSLNLDTILTSEAPAIKDTVVSDSAISILKDTIVRKKTQRKKAKKPIVKEPTAIQKDTNGQVKEIANGNGNGNSKVSIILGILITAIIATIRYFRSFSGPIDYESRKLLSRREYYRNVYLKSEAWKRKRYLVLKRDNGRCVYCGEKATQVHHTRYAKRNIGKEPIEWLVSICKTCHEAKHEQ